MKRLIITIAVLACTQAYAQETLVVLSPHSEAIKYEFADGFNRERAAREKPPVAFTWLDAGGTADIMRFVRSEFARSPSGINVDLLFGGGVDPFEELAQLGQLLPLNLPPPLLASIPPEINGVRLRDPELRWAAPVMAGFGIMCNRDVLQRLSLPVPDNWEALAQGRYRGWLSSADPTKSGSVHVAYEILLQAYGWQRGWQLLFALARNIRDFIPAASQVSVDLSAGEVACSFALDSQAWSLMREIGRDRISFSMPGNLSTITGDSVAIFRGAPHEQLAQEFTAYLFSPAAQRMWLLEKGSRGGPVNYTLARLPVWPGAYGADSIIPFNPYAWKSEFHYDSRRASGRWNLLNDLLRIFLIERHREIRAGVPVTMPYTEDEATALSDRSRTADASFRAGLQQTFRDQAQGELPRERQSLALVPIALTLLAALGIVLRKAQRRQLLKHMERARLGRLI